MNELFEQFRATLSESEKPTFDRLRKQVEAWQQADRAGGGATSAENVLLSLLWERSLELERLKRLLAGN